MLISAHQRIIAVWAVLILAYAALGNSAPCVEYIGQHTTGYLTFAPQTPDPVEAGYKIVYELSAAANIPDLPDNLKNNIFTMDMFLNQTFFLQSHENEGAVQGKYVVGFYDKNHAQIRLYYLSGFDNCTGSISDEELQRFARVGLFQL